MKSSTRYSGYDGYLKDQASKAKLPEWQRRLEADRENRVAWFRSRLEPLPVCFGPVLCLGARHGEEVEALWKLGFAGAVGLDIEPYPPWVRAGDMNRLAAEWKPESVSMVYTNAFDHCWEPRAFIDGIEQVLQPGGLAVMHLTFHLGRYETHVPTKAADVERLFCRSDIVMSRSIDERYGMRHELIAGKRSCM